MSISVQSTCQADVTCVTPKGCRVTGGGRQDNRACPDTDPISGKSIRHVTHGGQVGAPFAQQTDCVISNPCIRGQWQHVTFRVRHTPNYLIKDTHHLELIVIDPKREPLPITETGYLSHFSYEPPLPNAKAALAFFLDWIEREAKTKRWQRADLKRRQLDLFA